MRLACVVFAACLSAAALATPVSEQSLSSAWQALLSKHVDRRGAVSYRGFAQQRPSSRVFWQRMHSLT